MRNQSSAYLFTVALLAWATQAQAQSSSNLQGPTPPQPMRTDQGVVPSVPAKPASQPGQGGPSVQLQSVVITGNTLFGAEELGRALGEVKGKHFDMAGLNGLAVKIEAVYRAAGYPFTQAYLPAQDLKSGVLHITVLEGRYGTIRAAGKDNLPAGAQPFLDHGLKHGDPIGNKALERTLLILDDQPGMKIRPVIQPGAGAGEADLTVNVERSSYASGEVGYDNTGARSTGEHRLHASLDINSPFRYGDKIALNAMVTDQHMWLGSVDYSAPIGASGLRGQFGYAHTSYQLAGQFSALDAVGYANVTTAKLSYPLIRSQATNVLLSAGLQHKGLQDDYRAVSVVRNKTSDGVPLSLQFDRRDAVLGGGVTYGVLSALSANLHLDAASAATDALTAKSAGSYTKFNLDVARIQSIKGPLSLYARYSAQWASKNLDASEKFNLGGFYGVRAYPLGEGSGDQGWLGQVEARYAVGEVTPFIFYDAGHARMNAQPWDASSGATRDIAGEGFGVRAIHKGWSIETTLAWRSRGGAPTSDTADRVPRFFLMAGRKF